MKSLFGRLDTLIFPKDQINPDNWFTIQPCSEITIGKKKIIITQPSSSILVYLLGILTTALGIFFLFDQKGQLSRYWWGISMVLWGIGALLAGTSYQAFGYQLKCAGRDTCRWTSWWEVIYMIFQQVSMNAMLAAVAYSCAEGTLRTIIFYYSGIASIVFSVLVFAGAFVPLKTLITFEFMVLFSTPGFLFTIGLNGWRYYQHGDTMDLAFLITWISLIIVGLSYYLYYKLDFTKKLWSKKIWFSENDVLHITLIAWIIYIWGHASFFIKDL